MIGIYKITNLINGKSYIGQSTNIQKRFSAHKSVAFNPNDSNYNYPLYRAIRKYGIENFSFEVIEECDVSELNNKEIYYISKYNTYGKLGYNQDKGGNYASHYLKLSDELVDMIIQRLKTSLDNSDDIGKDFGVTGRTIRSINSGEYGYKNSETYPIREHLLKITADDTIFYCTICGDKITDNSTYCVECAHRMQRRVSERPGPLELANMIKENGFRAVGKKFGVSDNTIKKWCKHYNIPHKINELIEWYNRQLSN